MADHAEQEIILTGIVHGVTMEIEVAPGLPDGQPVMVILRPLPGPGGALRRAFGSWADDADGVDRFID